MVPSWCHHGAIIMCMEATSLCVEFHHGDACIATCIMVMLVLSQSHDTILMQTAYLHANSIPCVLTLAWTPHHSILIVITIMVPSWYHHGTIMAPSWCHHDGPASLCAWTPHHSILIHTYCHHYHPHHSCYHHSCFHHSWTNLQLAKTGDYWEGGFLSAVSSTNCAKCSERSTRMGGK